MSAADTDAHVSDLEAQTEEIRKACVRNGFESVEVVRDFESHSGSDLERPGLIYAIERLEAGEASCLVVTSLERLTRSAAHLGTLIDRLGESRIRLVVLDIQLDTGNPDGRLAAEALANVGTLERKSLDTRTRKGLEAARDARRSSGRPAVADRPALKERIADMRARGMTLQAIADTLNSEGVPTLRGGSEWRPSSVQAAVGYKRPKRGARKSANGAPGGPPTRRSTASPEDRRRPTTAEQPGNARFSATGRQRPASRAQFRLSHRLRVGIFEGHQLPVGEGDHGLLRAGCPPPTGGHSGRRRAAFPVQ